MDMTISDAGVKVLEEREGVRLDAYRDSRGIWTIGVGHTAMAGPPVPGPGHVMEITQSECDAVFKRDIAPVMAAINECNAPMLTQAQFDALVSFIHNIGTPNWRNSTVRRMLVDHNYNAAGHAMLMWKFPSEIYSRRMGEYVQYMHGEYVARVNGPVA